MVKQLRLQRRVVLKGLCASALATGGISKAFAASSTLERIKSEGKVRIGIANERPYGFVETDGRITGAIPDIVRAALLPHGVTDLRPEIVDFNALIPGLNSDRFDIIAAGMYIQPARCQAIAFSNPVTRAGYGFASLAGNPKGLHSLADVVARDGALVGTQTGSAQVDTLVRAGVPRERTMLFANAAEALAGLRAGRVDVIYFPSLELGALLNTVKDDRLERVLPFEQILKEDGSPEYGYAGFGLRKSDEGLRDLLNQEITRMLETGELLEIISQYGYGVDELPTSEATVDQLCTE